MLEWYWFPVDVLIPLFAAVLAGAIAGRYVSDQIGQLDRHRTSDRRAKGIVELAALAIADADLVISHIDAHDAWVLGGEKGAQPKLTALDRFRNNSHYVRAQALLSEDSPAIANWALAQSSRLYDETQAALARHTPTSKTVGPARGAAMRIANETTAALFAWQAEQRPTEWFVAQLDQPQSK